MTQNNSLYIDKIPVDLLRIAQSYANDNISPYIEPAHLFRAILNKSIGLINFIEDTLDEDYYYLVDWCDMHIQQCKKSPYGMKGLILSQETKAVIKEAEAICKEFGESTISYKFILAALVKPGVGFTNEQLKTMPLKSEKITACINKNLTKNNIDTQKEVSPVFQCDEDLDYCIPLHLSSSETDIIGFDDEIHSILEILARKDRANVLIIGDNGVGKTTLIHSILKLESKKELPYSLANIELYELDLISLCQGISYKTEIEDRFKKVVEHLSSKIQPILIIENFYRIKDKQSVISNILPNLKKALSQNKIQFICTSTIEGYTKDIEKDTEITSYFENISIEAPSEELATKILISKCKNYEDFHKIKIETEVPQEIVRLAKRYLSEKNLPSSAIDLLDRSMASIKIKNEFENTSKDKDSTIYLTKDDVYNIVAKTTGIPMGNIEKEERDKLSNAENILHNRVVGQNHAIKSILDAVFESRSGLNKKGQPIGSFFFMGPTGTGKTELAKALAEFLFNDDSAILRFDMSEYKEEHSVALLYGAPPGYVGYEEGGLLVNQIRQHPYSVVLFDEIEKAHKSVFDIFLQILDEGKLHDRLGRVGDFSNSLIIFTSNIGSDYIFNAFENKIIPTHDQMLEIMQGKFRPEFLARLTEIIPFSPITEEMIDKIFDIHIKNLLKTLNEKNITLTIDNSARKYITKVGFNAHYGARPILGIIRKEIRRPLSKLIISGEINPNDKVIMKYNESTKEIIWDIDTPE